MTFPKSIIKLGVLAVLVATVGLGCKGLSGEEQTAVKPVTINYWTVFDDTDGLRQLIQKYNAQHPQVKINIRSLRFEEFESELLNALAEDRGPDIVSLNAEWLKEYQTKLTSMPAQVSVPRVVYKAAKQDFTGNAVAPEIDQIIFETTALYSPRQVRDLFVSTVGEDVIFSDEKGVERVWGVPLSLDTLQLYYNRELLDKAGIPEPPTTWDEFNAGLKKLRKIDQSTGDITQAAAGLGRHDNVDRAADIVMLLMRQNGALVQDESGAPQFDKIPADGVQRDLPPGPEALAFYTDFANSAKNDVYTWNEKLPSSLDMFSRGNLAYFFGYSYHRQDLLARAPKLDYAITTFPQLNATPEYMANYWVNAVTKKSKNPDVAWHVVQFMSQAKNVEAYLKTAQRPTALRSLVKKQFEDEGLVSLRPFVEGALTAKGWYDGLDAKAAERIILSMIRRIHENDFTDNRANVYTVAVRDAVQQLNSTR